MGAPLLPISFDEMIAPLSSLVKLSVEAKQLQRVALFYAHFVRQMLRPCFSTLSSIASSAEMK